MFGGGDGLFVLPVSGVTCIYDKALTLQPLASDSEGEGKLKMCSTATVLLVLLYGTLDK